MSLIEINQDTCNLCGICAAECPGRFITLEDGGLPQPIERANGSCIRCGHCVVVCPTGSLRHRDMPVAGCIEIQKGLKITPEQCEQLLKSRRSVRAYKDEPVPREVITRLIEVARYAPTGHNAQGLEWLVIDSKEKLDRIEELGLEWIQWVMKNQPQAAAMLSMKWMLERQTKYRNVILRGAPVLIVVHATKDMPIVVIDSATALAYLDLAAQSLGLGTTWGGYVYMMAANFPPLKAFLALPENHAVYGCMMLGYNRFSYRRIPSRKEPRITWR